MKRVISILIIVILCFTSFSTVFANPFAGGGNSDVAANGQTNSSGGLSGAAGEIQSKGETILSAILWIGYAVALGMVVYIGIKYILGAAEAKANMKSAIVTWLIGAFVVFSCTTIVGWVTDVIGVNTAQQIVEKGGSLLEE